MVADAAEGGHEVILVDDDVVGGVGDAKVVDPGPETAEGRLVVDRRDLGAVSFVQVEIEGPRVRGTGDFRRRVIALAAFDLALVFADGVAQGCKEEAIDKTEGPPGKSDGIGLLHVDS